MTTFAPLLAMLGKTPFRAGSISFVFSMGLIIALEMGEPIALFLLEMVYLA
jgi:hypothetical protein